MLKEIQHLLIHQIKQDIPIPDITQNTQPNYLKKRKYVAANLHHSICLNSHHIITNY